MGKINCRGHENRIMLCKQYVIKPEFRIKMLKGIVASDSGGRITDELYIFSAYDHNHVFVDKIICGEPTAKDFLSIIREPKPALFNMLKLTKKTAERTDITMSYKKTASSVPEIPTNADTKTWHPVNKALYEAIMILIVVWQDTSGDSLLFREMRKCCKYPDKYPFDDRLIRFNTILSKDRRKTLANILESLKKEGNEIRDFDLKLLHEAVLKTGAESHIL